MSDSTATPDSGNDSTPAAPTSDDTGDGAPTGDQLGDGGKQALDSERKARRAAEKTARDATAQLEKLREASMSEQEKAVTEAEKRGRADGLKESGGRLVEARVRVAAAGRSVDVDALLEGLDRSRFIGDDGEPDVGAIDAWVDRVAPAPQEPKGPLDAAIDLGQGNRQTTSIGDDKGILNMLEEAVGLPKS